MRLHALRDDEKSRTAPDQKNPVDVVYPHVGRGERLVDRAEGALYEGKGDVICDLLRLLQGPRHVPRPLHRGRDVDELEGRQQGRLTQLGAQGRVVLGPFAKTGGLLGQRSVRVDSRIPRDLAMPHQSPFDQKTLSGSPPSRPQSPFSKAQPNRRWPRPPTGVRRRLNFPMKLLKAPRF